VQVQRKHTLFKPVSADRLQTLTNRVTVSAVLKSNFSPSRFSPSIILLQGIWYVEQRKLPVK